MTQQSYVLSSDHGFGAYLSKTRQACIDRVQPKNARDMAVSVTDCILNSLTELDKAALASRQYFLTLWPAFVGVFVALAPDPSCMVYDNVWWAGLFAITSAGLPGLDLTLPPHHVKAHSHEEGREMCETWHFDASKPKAMSKQETMGTRPRGRGSVICEWLAFFTSIALFLWFCVYFAITLKPAVDITFGSNWLGGALWYYASATPAVISLIFEFFRNRIELYEPVHQSMEDDPTSESTRKELRSLPAAQGRFTRTTVRSVFDLWLRILGHQWRRSEYRVLIGTQQSPRHEWFYVIGRGIAGGSRMALFAVGSITMGNILLMPVPNDIYLFILLLFTTGVPRQLWTAFWTNGNRGADLVVSVKEARIMGPLDTAQNAGPHAVHDRSSKLNLGIP